MERAEQLACGAIFATITGWFAFVRNDVPDPAGVGRHPELALIGVDGHACGACGAISMRGIFRFFFKGRARTKTRRLRNDTNSVVKRNQLRCSLRFDTAAVSCTAVVGTTEQTIFHFWNAQGTQEIFPGEGGSQARRALYPAEKHKSRGQQIILEPGSVPGRRKTEPT